MILMELCPHGALREFLQQSIWNPIYPAEIPPNNPKLPWSLLLQLASDICDALCFLHDHNIIHRDIKTTNVLVDAQCRAKLCDFSFACHDQSSIKKDFIYGTEEFMAPEIALGMDFTTSADIFSFGIILCEIITGREPNAEFLKRVPQSMFAVNENELRSAILEHCPDELQVMALQCCEGDPHYRPSASQCAEILQV